MPRLLTNETPKIIFRTDRIVGQSEKERGYFVPFIDPLRILLN